MRYSARCKCGNYVILEIEDDTSFRIFCGHCGTILGVHTSPLDTSSKTDNSSDDSSNLIIPVETIEHSQYVLEKTQPMKQMADLEPTQPIQRMDKMQHMDRMQRGTNRITRNDASNDCLKTCVAEIPTSSSNNIQSKQTQTSAPATRSIYIDKYKILKQLGQGSMGKVYLGIDEETNQKVAIKVMNQNGNERILDYFIREAQVLIQLHHPNIIALKKYGNFQGSPFIAMEYAEGSTLEEVLNQHPISVRYALEIVIYILDALEYVSHYHIVHRDIKPTNIIIGKNSKSIKLIDFGVGKSLEDQNNLTKTGQIVGTIYYMAPEQLQNAVHVDYRADIYAVGATLYHALANCPPFEENGSNMVRVLMAKTSNQYITLGQRGISNLSNRLISIVEKAMAFNPKDRFNSAKEMQAELMNVYKEYI